LSNNTVFEVQDRAAIIGDAPESRHMAARRAHLLADGLGSIHWEIFSGATPST
jgi:hypothetical protein